MPILADNTQKFINMAEKKVHEEMEKLAKKIEEDAKNICPVSTGALRDSITHVFDSEGNVHIGSNLEYALSVEIGTNKTAAQPYLRPALHGNT